MSVVRDFLKFVVPRGLDTPTGFVITSMNDVSTQCDIVVFDSRMTPLYREGDRQRFFRMLEENQRFIESLVKTVKRYQIPTILIAERMSGDGYELSDGLQRLHAIVAFIDTGFATLDVNFLT